MWDVQWDLTRDIVGAFKEAGIEIAFPQVDIHLDRMQ
jgi:small-conductance mechanosensitive channel